MAVTISPTGDLRLDQTALLQTGGTLDKDDISLGDPDNPDLGALPDAFASFLGGLTSLNLKNAATYGGAQESPTGSFITVETDGEPINDLFFSRDNGTLFTGQIATYTDANADTHPLAVAGSTAVAVRALYSATSERSSCRPASSHPGSTAPVRLTTAAAAAPGGESCTAQPRSATSGAAARSETCCAALAWRTRRARWSSSGPTRAMRMSSSASRR